MEANTSYWSLAGLFPYIKTKGKYNFSGKLFALSVASVTTGTMASIYFDLNRDTSMLPPVSFLNLVFARILAILLPIHNFYLHCFESAKVPMLMDRLEMVDVSLRWHGLSFDKKNPSRRYVYYMCYVLCFYVYFVLTDPSNHKMFLAYAYYRLMWTFSVLHLTDFLEIIHSYLLLLERLVSKKCTTKQLECLVYNHNRLCATASLFNGIFDLSLFLAVSHVFLYILYFFIFVSSYFEAFGIAMFKQELPNIMGVSVILLNLKFLVSHCVNTGLSSKRFSRLVYKAIMEDISGQISNDVKLNLHISMRRSIIYTACGFFTIDNTLLLSMLSAASNYIIILIQFGKPHASKNQEEVTTPPSLLNAISGTSNNIFNSNSTLS